ncbi:uncharacterized protein MKK02DRAFT_43232 [Dioszegia hungarica]|uniref:Uncharacterized protein n=1 Tax=Dioszegia hungarica TaxID=4972 RepID=A0AA38HCP9_9TREE|nr:uncharacterized protein MKK02DRAFT_43232 [Dioszegia hungarica]KAI9637309.1 hypothetical protein MKK02DRAFT_43232 [Dioszegia hungarica]
MTTSQDTQKLTVTGLPPDILAHGIVPLLQGLEDRVSLQRAEKTADVTIKSERPTRTFLAPGTLDELGTWYKLRQDGTRAENHLTIFSKLPSAETKQCCTHLNPFRHDGSNVDPELSARISRIAASAPLTSIRVETVAQPEEPHPSLWCGLRKLAPQFADTFMVIRGEDRKEQSLYLPKIPGTLLDDQQDDSAVTSDNGDWSCVFASVADSPCIWTIDILASLLMMDEVIAHRDNSVTFVRSTAPRQSTQDHPASTNTWSESMITPAEEQAELMQSIYNTINGDRLMWPEQDEVMARIRQHLKFGTWEEYEKSSVGRRFAAGERASEGMLSSLVSQRAAVEASDSLPKQEIQERRDESEDQTSSESDPEA